MQETAEQVQQKAVEVKEQAGERVRRELDTRSSEAGEQLGLTAGAMRRTAEQLRSDGSETPARVVTAVADRAERLGTYMTQVNADQMLRDVENFARRQPLLFAVGGATMGFLASRFMKASSNTRYQGNGAGGSHPAPQAGLTTGFEQASAAGVYSTQSKLGETDQSPSSATGAERGGSSGNAGR
ncbi:MAG TPA: hypothetical protein VM049_02730 [Gaiellaceae bacterium]|nr:hypothetical protein [Gaiellaceae bacterium]